MSEELRALIERSIQAYRRGRYMRLFGKEYQQYVDSHSDAEVSKEILGTSKYLEPLQAAFQDHAPRPDEIYLYAIRRSAVVTNQRLFLLNKSGLMRPPIDLSDIANYKGPRRVSPIEQIDLTTGEKIERRPKGSLDEKVFRKLINRSNDPKAALSLHVPVSETALARQKKEGTHQARKSTTSDTSAGSRAEPVERDESFGSILREFWPALVGFCAFVIVLIANGAPIFDGGPAVIRWLSIEGNMFFFYLGVIVGVIAAIFAARGELIPGLLKTKSRKGRRDG